jgi:uncharacterized protein YkvS
MDKVQVVSSPRDHTEVDNRVAMTNQQVAEAVQVVEVMEVKDNQEGTVDRVAVTVVVVDLVAMVVALAVVVEAVGDMEVRPFRV